MIESEGNTFLKLPGIVVAETGQTGSDLLYHLGGSAARQDRFLILHCQKFRPKAAGC